MDGFLALVIIVGFITVGITVSVVTEIKNPKPEKSLNKFDVVNEELRRLHGELAGTFDKEKYEMLMDQIATFKEVLIQKEVEDSDKTKYKKM